MGSSWRDIRAAQIPRRQFLHLVAGTAALSVGPRMAGAQSYPSRPITMIVPYPAGGPTDTVARIMAEAMKVSLGQSIVVENVSGAGGSIGVGRVAHSAGDGYTIGLGQWNTHVANGALYALPYDVVKDFQPLSLLVSFPYVAVARRTMPAKDLNGLIGWLKANSDKASQGSAGVGGLAHITGVLFQNLTGTHFQHVPYRGSAPAMQDLIAGQIDIIFDAPAIILPQVRVGTIKAYAVMATARLAIAPDIPTADEAGLPGLYALNWLALWAPKDTPKNAVAKLNNAIVEALADPATRQRFADLGFDVAHREQQMPDALAAFQKAEIEKWWPIIKAANIKGE
jgi:tripartite-type tricarboxylate transporter receptor subunit TctC